MSIEREYSLLGRKIFSLKLNPGKNLKLINRELKFEEHFNIQILNDDELSYTRYSEFAKKAGIQFITGKKLSATEINKARFVIKEFMPGWRSRIIWKENLKK